MKVAIILRYFCILLQSSVGYTKTYDTTVQEVSSAVMSLNVTASRGNTQTDGTFYDVNVTWFDAVQQCSDGGYDKLESSNRHWQRWHSIVQRLRDNNYRFPVYIWVGLFRIFPYNSTWYHGTNTCKEFRGTAHDSDNTTWQCLSAYFTNFNTSPVMKARYCLDEYPFICSTQISGAKAILYAGFKMEALPGGVRDELTFTNSTYDCQQSCDTLSGCIAYEYNNGTLSCRTVFAENYYGYATYTLVRSENTSHVLIRGCNYTFSTRPVNNNTLPTSQNMFNTCNLTFIPERFCAYPDVMTNHSDSVCPCTNCESTNHTADGIFYAEIPKRSTSLSKRRYTSANDDRTVSKVSGGIAVVIIVVPFCVCAFVDVTNIRTRSRKRHKSKCITAKRAGHSKTDRQGLVKSEGPDQVNMTMTMTSID